MKRIPMIDGDEYDALTKWKRYIRWRSGQRKRIKRRYNKRERRMAKVDLRSLVTFPPDKLLATFPPDESLVF